MRRVRAPPGRLDHLAGAVLAAMAALAVHDARRAMVDPRMVLALLGAAAAWRFAGPNGTDGAWARFADGVLGAALGVACVTVPIAAAQLCGRRWPLYPGDAMLLGAFGFLLGIPGLAWTMLLGSGFALIYRFWLQRRRGRPFRKGLVPLGPGMCAGAAVVFLCASFGVALADGAVAEATGAGTRPVPLPATELAPVLGALPAGLAAREVSLGLNQALPFPAVVRRLAAVSGVAITIEERPARVTGGAMALADPAGVAPVLEHHVARLGVAASASSLPIRRAAAPPPAAAPLPCARQSARDLLQRRALLGEHRGDGACLAQRHQASRNRSSGS